MDDIVPGLAHPFAVHTPALGLVIAGAVLLVPCSVLTIADAGRRLWKAQSPEREQLAWLLTAVVLAVAIAYTPWETVRGLGFMLVPLAVVVGVVRHRLLDLQVAVAAALVAVGLLPARDLLQRAVDHLVYGERRDPLRAVASLSRHVAEQDDASLVPQVLRTVAAAGRSPHVVLVDTGGEAVAEAGVPAPGELLEVPLQEGGRPVGGLRVAPRTARDGWSGDDHRLLGLLAQQVAAVAHANLLNAELADSRDRVVRATAQERQRLHQELHDGLGPALSGIALGLEAAEAALEGAPERVPVLLARLRAETQNAGKEVRRLVEGLRPAALAAHGLPDALASFVEGLRSAAAGRLEIRLELPHALPPLGPDTEAAAYRVVTEAVTNVVRHSGGRTCRVAVTAEDAGLRLVVEDDGSGLPAQPRDGVGLVSMRRRAAVLGGTWSAGPRPGGGTRIDVQLPAGRPAEVTA